jgi:hypothetical protein
MSLITIDARYDDIKVSRVIKDWAFESKVLGKPVEISNYVEGTHYTLFYVPKNVSGKRLMTETGNLPFLYGFFLCGYQNWSLYYIMNVEETVVHPEIHKVPSNFAGEQDPSYSSTRLMDITGLIKVSSCLPWMKPPTRK